MRITHYLVAALVTLGGSDVVLAACPNNTQTTIVYGNGIGRTKKEARADAANSLVPPVLAALDPGIDPSCITFHLAYDSNFVDSNNRLVNIAVFIDEIAVAMAQLGIDFGANFWSYRDFIVEPPTEVQDIQRTLITSATSIFQPDLLIHEGFYNSEIALGHNIVVVAHSQGNLYVNQAYSVVTSLGGQELFHVVSLATPAPSVQDPGGKYFKLFRDVLALVGLPPNISNGPPSPCLLLLGSIACHSFAESYMADRDDPSGDKSDTTRPAIVGAVLGFLPTTVSPANITPPISTSGITGPIVCSCATPDTGFAIRFYRGDVGTSTSDTFNCVDNIDAYRVLDLEVLSAGIDGVYTIAMNHVPFVPHPSLAAWMAENTIKNYVTFARTAGVWSSSSSRFPSIVSIDPAHPDLFPGAHPVTVSGSNFQQGLSVLIKGPVGISFVLSGSNIQSVTGSSFTMLLNLVQIPGAYSLQVVNANGQASNIFSFTGQ